MRIASVRDRNSKWHKTIASTTSIVVAGQFGAVVYDAYRRFQLATLYCYFSQFLRSHPADKLIREACHVLKSGTKFLKGESAGYPDAY